MQARRQSKGLHAHIFNGVAGTISKIAVFVDWVTLPQLMRGLHGSAAPLTPTRNRAFIVDQSGPLPQGQIRDDDFADGIFDTSLRQKGE